MRESEEQARQRFEAAAREYLQFRFDGLESRQDDEQEYQLEEMRQVAGSMQSFIMDEYTDVVF